MGSMSYRDDRDMSERAVFRRPKITRLVDGELVEQEISGKPVEASLDYELAAQVAAEMLDPGRAPSRGIQDAFRRHEATTGSGEGYAYDDMRPEGGYGGDHGEGDVSQTEYFDGDEGAADLFDQPAREPRLELFDDAAGDDHTSDPGYLDDYGDEFNNGASPTIDLDDRRPSRIRTQDDNLSTFARLGLK